MCIRDRFGILPWQPGDGPTVWVEFISSVIFFILASFGLSAALLKTKVPMKIVYALLKLSKGRTEGVLLAFMASTACVSLFVSDIPCCALFAGIAMSTILTFEEAEPGTSKLGRALMIAIPYAAAIGGQAFPSGSSMNIMAIGLLESLTGVHISFLQDVYKRQPGSIAWGLAVDQQTNGIQAAQAILSIAAITGNLDVPGGVTVGAPNSFLGKWRMDARQEVDPDDWAQRLGAEEYPCLLYTSRCV